LDPKTWVDSETGRFVEWGEIMFELQELRERHARELELTPRADLN
jgi:hypothetical protein